MALVAYSDSEGSDTEAPPAPTSKPATTKPLEATPFRKVEGRKIKVDLPAVKPEDDGETAEDRPVKRARTSGAFSGFNSLLPAPKKAVAQSTLSRGVNLKTSSEAAFSRRPVSHEEGNDAGPPDVGSVEVGGDGGTSNDITSNLPATTELKIVGKATKFKPLSVGAAKKKKKPAIPSARVDSSSNGRSQSTSVAVEQETGSIEKPISQTVAKPKRSLFSVAQNEQDVVPEVAPMDDYEAMTTIKPTDNEPSNQEVMQPSAPLRSSNSHSLDSLASSLNLTAAQRRQLFGRNSKSGDINIAHFNMDAEYASNEQLRQAGEVMEHKAVKSIAPGKHSLQQLVNNARSQQDNLEDKWAEGRRERGEGSSKYGWGK